MIRNRFSRRHPSPTTYGTATEDSYADVIAVLRVACALFSVRPPVGEDVMAKVVFASSLTRWLPAGAGGGEASVEIDAETIGAALDGTFSEHPALRGYVLDEP